MVTQQQAMTERDFHFGECIRRIGPRGGVTLQQEWWRRSGMTKTWKTRPSDFRLPISYGLYQHSYLDHDNASTFHAASDCQPREIRS